MQTANRSSDAAARSLQALRILFRDAFAREFSVRLWDGSVVRARERERFSLVLAAPYSLRAVFMPPIDLNPGRAYALGLIDVEGDIEAAVDALAEAGERLRPVRVPLLLSAILRLPRPPSEDELGSAQLHGKMHSRERDAAAVAFHYDQPIGFYRSFLDPEMVYSCAYWDDGVRDLAGAQIAKIDHILRKVRLVHGASLLDVGCGWGALVLRAATAFGARATGITLSRAQCDEARRRVAALGLGDRVTIELRDYRDLGGRTFDAITSVGMAEHVGRANLPVYFETLARALRPGGLFLNHAIADQSPDRRGFKAYGFMDRYVFPDGELVAVSDMNLIAERSGFEIRDVENLREHYARTLHEWVTNLEANHDDVVRATSERTYRVWRLYMAGSAQGFRTGRMSIFQTLLAKPPAGGDLGLPPTRRGLYA